MPTRESRLQDIRDIKSSFKRVQAANSELEKQIAATQRKVVTAFKRDKRKVGHWNSATSTLNLLLQAGLKSIPLYGGYFGLAFKVMKDPVKGAWEVSRTEVGPWNLFGGATNGVMSPLGVSAAESANFNYASGRVSAFNDIPHLKAAQFESDVFDLVNTTSIYAQSMGLDMSVAKPKLEVATQNKAYLEWRHTVLEHMLNGGSNDSWLWHSMAECVASMRATHEGCDDLENGVFNTGSTPNAPLLVAGAPAMKELLKTKKSSKISSRYSNLHLVLSNYERPPTAYANAGKWVDRNANETDILSPSTKYRVECTKALVVAYQGEVRRALAETVSKNLFALINTHAGAVGTGAVRPFRYTDKHKESRENQRHRNNLLVGLASPLRVLGAALPSKIYNHKTTLESKKWGRFLCAVSVFYSVLQAYFDKQFVCDEVPSGRTYRLFLIAFADAFNTAMEYFCHVSNTKSARADAALYLQNTLTSLLQIDPAIAALLESLTPWDLPEDIVVEPLGLSGFTHLNCCTRGTRLDLSRGLATDRYSKQHNLKVSVLNRYVGELQEARRVRSNAAQDPTPGRSAQQVLAETRSLAASPLAASPLAQAINPAGVGQAASLEVLVQNYGSTLDAVIADPEVPLSVQTHLLAMHKVLERVISQGKKPIRTLRKHRARKH